jgi:hypothetical protein
MMKTNHTIRLLLVAAASAMLGNLLCAQPTVAPTNEPVGNPRGDEVSGYNILNSSELGYRWASIGGDLGMYKAVANYTDGLRLLSSSFNVQSKDGHGKFFDHLQITTSGLGNDPYEFATLKIDKNKLYRYDLVWRQSEYFNPALTISNGQHARDTTRDMQDHDLTLFPQSNIKFFLGYSRNVNSGPALSTVQLFDVRGDEYPTFADIREQQNEYRLGAEAGFMGWKLHVTHAWVDYKQDTPTQIFTPQSGISPGNNPNDLNTLSSYRLNEPFHGTSPYWRVGLFHNTSKLWAVNGRFSYVGGNRAFTQNELATGTTFVGALSTQQILAFGTGSRPAATGNLNVTLFPTDKITVNNQTSLYNIRMEGDSAYSQYFLGNPVVPVLQFTYLGIRTIANSTDIEYRPNKWFGVHAGYQYSDRRIAAIDDQKNLSAGPPVPPQSVPLTQTNILQEGTFGFRIRPVKGLAILLDGDIGHNNKPYAPISDKDYQAFRGRIEYKQKTWRATAYAKTDYNNNSISLTSFASKSRNYGLDASWTPNEWFAIDAGYAKLHYNSLGGIDFFVSQQLTSGQSLYISNIHTANLMAHFTILKRADLLVGYSHTQDVGDGRSVATGTPVPAVAPVLPPPGVPIQFFAAQTLPLRFESPQARLSIRINRQIRWNAGYQYYGYNEKFSSLQDFRAQTGFSSLSFAF